MRIWELKRILYWMLFSIGIAFLLSLFLPFSHGSVSHVASSISDALIFAAGFILVLFAVVTYLLRDDPDIWR